MWYFGFPEMLVDEEEIGLGGSLGMSHSWVSHGQDTCQHFLLWFLLFLLLVKHLIAHVPFIWYVFICLSTI